MRKLLAMILLTVLTATAGMGFEAPADPLAGAAAPEVSYDGLIEREVPAEAGNDWNLPARPVATTEGDYADEVWLLAQAICGESYPDDFTDQIKVGMTILNRVDDPRWPDTLYGVITQPNQIHGYSAFNEPSGLYLESAEYVINTWHAIKDGADLPWCYDIFFWSAGAGHNDFRTEY